MGAKDTVMNDRDIAEWIGLSEGFRPTKEGKRAIYQFLAKRQAEISFKAGKEYALTAEGVKASLESIIKRERLEGIREVVEWVCDNSPTIQIGQDLAPTASGFCGKLGQTTYYPLIKLFDWQTKLKEWGI